MNIRDMLPDGWILLKAELQKDGMVDLAVKPPSPIREVDGVGGLRRLPTGVWAGMEEPEDIEGDIQTLEAFRTNRSGTPINERCKKIQREIDIIQHELKHEMLSQAEIDERERRREFLLGEYVKCKGGE